MAEEGVEVLPQQEQGNETLKKQRAFLLDTFRNNKCGVMVMGGVAVDLLLNGSLSRPHKDIDMLAFGEDEGAVCEAFQQISCETSKIQGNVSAIQIKRGNIDARVGLMRRGNNGPLLECNFNGKPFLLEFGDDFKSNIVPTEGGQVETISPEGMMKTLNVNLAIGLPMRPQDEESRRLIQEKFFPSESPTSPRFLPKATALRVAHTSQ